MSTCALCFSYHSWRGFGEPSGVSGIKSVLAACVQGKSLPRCAIIQGPALGTIEARWNVSISVEDLFKTCSSQALCPLPGGMSISSSATEGG